MIKITIANKDGKLSGIPSLNTSSLDNKFCQRQKLKKGVVCQKCYSAKFEKFRTTMTENFIENGRILSTQVLKQSDVPVINSLYFRFNSFGELINKRHLENLIRICEWNPKVWFSLWTKRGDLIKPKLIPLNMRVIWSMSRLDYIELVPRWADQVYAVTLKNGKLNDNCRGKCIDCLLCYGYHKDITEKYIISKLR